MVLDTNVKRFKYSGLCKFLCIFLSMVTFLYSGYVVLNTINAVDYFGRDKAESVTDFTGSSRFRVRFSTDLQSKLQGLQSEYQGEQFEKKAKAQRQELINAAYKKYIAIEKKQKANDEAEEKYMTEEYDYDEYQSTTYVVDDNFSVKVKDTGRELNFYYYDISNNVADNASEADIKKVIASAVDSEIENKFFDYNSYYYLPDGPSFKVYANYKGKTTSNLEEGDTRENIVNHKIYFICEGDKLTVHGVDENTVKYIQDIFKDEKPEDFVMYGYIDLPDEIQHGKNIIEAIDDNDVYVSMMECYDTAFKFYDDMNINIVKVAVLLIISFFLGITYLTIAGKKSKEEKAKLAFIDYIPAELHLAIWAAAGFGLSLLYFGYFENLFTSMYFMKISVAYGAALWLMVMEFAGSVSRQIMSEKKFYKFLLIYWILFGIFMIFKGYIILNKKLFTAIKKSAKRTSDRTKRVFSYKPQKFVKNVIALSILYFAVNLIIILIGTLFAAAGAGVVTVIMAFVLIVANILVIREVCLYFKNLDQIIISAQSRQNLIADIDALPQSLKILANSMRYTNIELQNAINKAVKDERLRTELITNVSHDLKTPLTSIITYVDLLSKCDINDPKAQEYIKVLEDKGARLKRLIDDLLEASKVTSGNVTVNLSPMNLSELCLQSTVDVQADFEKAGLELVVKQGENPSIVVADGTKTFRVIQNLLSNARKYSAKGSRVYVSVYNEGNSGIFEVKNISAQPLDITPDELTERFVRGDKSRNQEGNGLGLSIAKELCRLQNGQLQLYIDGDLFKARVRFPLNK